ncbi:hypothetical protein HMPREF1349_00192 [Enterococcus faecium 506]|nr:hypothetical protein HMPREF1349_00192 [Enterococcus faecium 506]
MLFYWFTIEKFWSFIFPVFLNERLVQLWEAPDIRFEKLLLEQTGRG